MELFEIIPSNLFTVLTSKNRETYVSALLVLRQSFKQNMMLDKDVLVGQLTNSLQSNIFDLDASADEENIKETLSGASSYARFIVRKFQETGWIQTEFASNSRLKEYVTLPPYSLKMINLIYELVNEESKVYDSYLYSVYSSLKSADEEYVDFRYTALLSVVDKLNEFEDVLKNLFHNLKRKHTNLSGLKTINQVLYDHFDQYQKTIISQIYLPFKTKDSISRFKGPILTILSKWMKDMENIDKMVGNAIVQNRYKTKDDAQWGILSMFNQIIDKLADLEELVELIDERNQAYVQASTEKMRYLLKKDKSIKGKLTKIIEKLASEREQNVNDSINHVRTVLTLTSQGYISENSLFNRSNMRKDMYDDEPQELVLMDDTRASELLLDFEKSNSSAEKFSTKSIIEFMHAQMDEINSLSSKDMIINDMDTLIMVMYSFIRGYDARMFYRLKLNDGDNIVNGDYLIPDFEFIRKKVK